MIPLCIRKNVTIFESLMGPRKSSCDIPSVTTQGQDCPYIFFWLKHLFPPKNKAFDLSIEDVPLVFHHISS
jgi:hypothetical protein